MPKSDRTRIKENIRIALKSGNKKVALDLALHIFFVDTLSFYGA